MADPTSHPEHECRHCSGLCAGANAKCPYCKRWLRRDDTELVTHGDRAGRLDRGPASDR